MDSYSLSDEALEDLDRLYEFGLLNFGLQKADDYYDNLLLRLEQIAQTPFLYPAVSHIREGYRLSVYGKHSIFYQIFEAQSVLVVRIIGRQRFE